MKFRDSCFKTLTAFIVFSLCTGIAEKDGAITCYVDATSGNDSYDGMSPEMPWKTISKVNTSLFQPGDNVLFNSGQSWREQLIAPSSGISGNPVTFRSYGTGAHPG